VDEKKELPLFNLSRNLKEKANASSPLSQFPFFFIFFYGGKGVKMTAGDGANNVT